MDWPLIGAVSAVTIVAGVVAYEVVVLVAGSAPEPVKRPPALASYGTSVERTAYELPGFATGRPAVPTPSFPLIRLIDPDRTFPIEGGHPGTLAPPPPQKNAPAPPPSAKAEPPRDSKVAKLSTPDIKPGAADPPPAQPRVDQWRVSTTSKASYFNLGGHIDRSGMVDDLASGHLRDALKSHRNFGRLPPDIKTHILTQNINLPKIAPYRGLLGIDDKTMEEEQGIRFERIVANR